LADHAVSVRSRYPERAAALGTARTSIFASPVVHVAISLSVEYDQSLISLNETLVPGYPLGGNVHAIRHNSLARVQGSQGETGVLGLPAQPLNRWIKFSHALTVHAVAVAGNATVRG
jgi:hypothetical protein